MEVYGLSVQYHKWARIYNTSTCIICDVALRILIILKDLGISKESILI